MAVTFSDLRDEVLILVRDNSAASIAAADVHINEALMTVADVAVIPELKRIGTFTTVVGQAWAAMPTGFNGKLLFVGNDSTSLAIADGGVAQLMEETPLLDSSGPVHTVALEGSTIYYQGIPSSATAYPILYTIWPTAFAADADEVPSYFPEHLQRGLFIHYAAAKIFNMIEDGIEGDKVNTQAQFGLHAGYVQQFKEYLGKRKVAANRSVWLN